MATISITDTKTGKKKTITTPKNLTDLEALQDANVKQFDNRFKRYRRTNVVYLRPYESGEDLLGVSVSSEDNPAQDMGFVAINPDNFADQWYVAKDYASKNFLQEATDDTDAADKA